MLIKARSSDSSDDAEYDRAIRSRSLIRSSRNAVMINTSLVSPVRKEP